MHTSIFAPAKLNLFLAITGRRPDGFHDLVSVVAPLALGDTLSVEMTAAAPGQPRFQLTCTDPEVPVDGTNLVIRAAEAFAAATNWAQGARFRLEKRVPMGAGLGGGSSDGVAALRALNTLAGDPLDRSALAALAATLGSDCPLFLHDGPMVMRGRGERLSALPEVATRRLRKRAVLVFKPAFGIPTAWAYRRMAEAAKAGVDGVYLSTEAADRRLADWAADETAGAESLLFNNLERPAFEKHLALPTLLDHLRCEFQLAPRMTGSGSACFAFLPDQAPVDAICAAIRASWGDSAYIIATQLA